MCRNFWYNDFMKITSLQKLKPKKLIVFDLDGTLAESKTPMDKEMIDLVVNLLNEKKVAVIGGGKLGVFELQLLHPLRKKGKLLNNLFIFPTTATSFYRYKNGWKKVYYLELSKTQRAKIKKTFQRVFKEIGYKHPQKTYGPIVEDRRTQVTFSVFGQEIVTILGKKGVDIKKKWTEENTPTKMKIAKLMQKYLPEFSVRAAGHTSIDVTKKGIAKAYGLKQIEKRLKVKIKDMVFIGDAIFPGGNDYAVTKTPVDYIAVKDPQETKKVIKHLLK